MFLLYMEYITQCERGWWGLGNGRFFLLKRKLLDKAITALHFIPTFV